MQQQLLQTQWLLPVVHRLLRTWDAHWALGGAMRLPGCASLYEQQTKLEFENPTRFYDTPYEIQSIRDWMKT
jgi:hypothetical protein